MAAQTTKEETDLGALLGGIVRDAEVLLGQQIELAKVEVGREVRKAAGAGVSLAAGGGLTAAGGLLTGLAAVHLVHKVTRLPLWTVYGAAGGALAAAGLALIRSGREGLAGVRLLPPPETAAALRENATWLKERVDPTTG